MCEWQLLSLSDSLWPHALYSPWNFPGQNGEWVAVPFSRGSSQRRDRSQVSHISGTFFTSWTIREAHCIAFICVHSFIPQSEEWCPRGRTSMLTDAGTCEVFGNSVVHSGWRAGCEARQQEVRLERSAGTTLGRVFAQPRSVGFQRKGSDWRVLGSGWKSPAVWRVGRNRRCTESC